MKKLLLLFALLPLQVFAAPFVITDTLTPGVSQCGVFLDTSAKQVVPVTAVTTPATGNICKFDIGSVTPGSHTLKFSAISVNDPLWGSQESAPSIPFVFVRPGAPGIPTGLTPIP